MLARGSLQGFTAYPKTNNKNLMRVCMVRKGIAALVIFAAGIVAVYTALFWNNNRAVSPPTHAELDSHWESSVQWLLNNRELVLRDQNPILWWMIGESARVSGDERLRNLFDDFVSQYNPRSIWTVFFTPENFRNTAIPPEVHRRFADYQQYFLFALSCNRQMALQPVIAAQHETNFCWRAHPLSPACATHQLMGFRFAQRSYCAEVNDLPEKIEALQNRITAQLTWDPRVVDVYIQRLVTLTDSGAGSRIKPRWLQRVLKAQLSDGSWSALEPLLPVGGNRYFGFNARLAGVGELKGDLHATAQGLWLLSLLRAQQ